MKIFTRFFITIAVISFVVTLTPNKSFAIDINDVHQRLYIKGMTKFDNLDEFRPNDEITRGEAAKFITQYAKVLNMGKTYTECTFTDISKYDATLVPFIEDVCAYGLIKGSQGKYMPTGKLTEAQAATIVIRSLEGFMDETKYPWYIDYYNRAKELGMITTETINSVDSTNITRGKLGTWLFLAYAGKPIIDTSDDTTVGVSMNVTTSSGTKTDITGKIEVEVEKEAKISGYMDYDKAILDKAISQGQQVVLFFNASQYPICKTLDADLSQVPNIIPKNLVVLNINYDTATALKQQYNVTTQHTLIYLNKSGGILYKNVGKELSVIDIVTVIITANGNADLSKPTI